MISAFVTARFRYAAPLSSSLRARVTFTVCVRGMSTRMHLVYNEGRSYTSLSTGWWYLRRMMRTYLLLIRRIPFPMPLRRRSQDQAPVAARFWYIIFSRSLFLEYLSSRSVVLIEFCNINYSPFSYYFLIIIRTRTVPSVWRITLWAKNFNCYNTLICFFVL